MKRDTAERKLFQLIGFDDNFIRFSDDLTHNLYLTHQTDAQRMEFLNSFDSLELEYRIIERDRLELMKKRGNLGAELMCIRTPYSIDANFSINIGEAPNSVLVALRLEFFHLPSKL